MNLAELWEKVDSLPMPEAVEWEERVDRLQDPLEDSYKKLAELEQQLDDERQRQVALRAEMDGRLKSLEAEHASKLEMELGKQSQELIAALAMVHDYALEEDRKTRPPEVRVERVEVPVERVRVERVEVPVESKSPKYRMVMHRDGADLLREITPEPV